MKSTVLACIAALTLFAIMGISDARAGDTFKVLHEFGLGNDGWTPESGLVLDNAGNLYGTTTAGGTGCSSNPGCGIVFELTPNANGSWTEGILHNFTGTDGAHPYAAPVFDSRGNLYGTTHGDGVNNQGTVFELSADSSGTWNALLLHSFTGGWDGAYPYGGVSLDSSGRVYGTTSSAGTYNDGVTFNVTGQAIGGEIVLHTFAGGSDGIGPTSTLISDASGNLYGTTYSGGSNGAGTIFKVSPNRHSPGWAQTLLYTFRTTQFGSGVDGANPYAGLVLDASGNLYGTTLFGGSAGGGTVFKVSPNADGSWTESIIYAFQGALDGNTPYGSLVFDAAGNLYGTTAGGGPRGYGTVFKLTPSLSGQWTETILYGFSGGVDGGWPGGGVILDKAGNLYGTAAIGGYQGLQNAGVVFEITP